MPHLLKVAQIKFCLPKDAAYNASSHRVLSRIVRDRWGDRGSLFAKDCWTCKSYFQKTVFMDTFTPPHPPPLAILSKPIERGEFYAAFSLLRAVSSDLQEVFCHDHIEFVISASRQESHAMTTTQRFGGFKRYPNQGMFPYRTFQSRGFTLHCFFLCGWMIRVWKPKDEASLTFFHVAWHSEEPSTFAGFWWIFLASPLLRPYCTKSLVSTQ